MSTNKTNIASLIYFTESKIVCTGGVVFVGDGHTGKTHTAINITSYKSRAFFNPEDDSLKKSVNLELDYFIFQSNIEEYLIKTTSQIFIMPGQKGRSKIGEGLAFEDAVDLYFHISPIKVVLALVLTFDLTDMNTFQELEYWLNRAIERDIVQDTTSIIILGTHLDSEGLIVTDEDIETAKTFVHQTVLDKIGLDVGIENIHSVKVSNITNDGIEELKQTINTCFLSAFNIFGFLDYKKNNGL
ncbi:MAG: hypothetical protein JXA54_01840 [Candidatus Heimdallarchaeota archaeon]|nr:hypothetical protein [Candidatus Heimdallarchaeota archaeon]